MKLEFEWNEETVGYYGRKIELNGWSSVSIDVLNFVRNECDTDIDQGDRDDIMSDVMQENSCILEDFDLTEGDQLQNKLDDLVEEEIKVQMFNSLITKIEEYDK